MRLYFLRHADSPPGADDAVRPLSKLGQRQAKVLADMLANAGIVFDAAYSSPLVRARETAEIILPVTNNNKRIILELTDALLNEEKNERDENRARGECRHEFGSQAEPHARFVLIVDRHRTAGV